MTRFSFRDNSICPFEVVWKLTSMSSIGSRKSTVRLSARAPFAGFIIFPVFTPVCTTGTLKCF